MSAPTPWRNRIVRANVLVAPDQLLANGKNWRIHPTHQQRYMQGALDELGWIQVVTLQEGTDLVIDGHMRIALALSKGELFVPVNYVDLDDEEADKALASLDAITAYATPDREQLASLYGGMGMVNANMAALLSQFNQHSALLAPQVDHYTRRDELRPEGQDGHPQAWASPDDGDDEEADEAEGDPPHPQTQQTVPFSPPQLPEREVYARYTLICPQEARGIVTEALQALQAGLPELRWADDTTAH